MDNDKDLGVTIFDDLFSLPEESSLLDIKSLVFLIDPLLKGFELLATYDWLGRTFV
jgi:hypothetical protein